MLPARLDQLAAERARALFDYDPETGLLTWREKRGNHAAGAPCGGRAGKYPQVRADGILYQQHRVIWLMMTGRWPEADIDHRDEDKRNNRWSNLREATRLQNLGNISLPTKRSLTGFRGVSCRWNRYSAVCKVGPKNVFLGTFATPEEASAVYEAFRADRYGEFAPSTRRVVQEQRAHAGFSDD